MKQLFKNIHWFLIGRRHYRRWLRLLDEFGAPVTVHHESVALYGEGPYGPTTLGEFIGMRDVFVARMILDQKVGYTWTLDDKGRFVNGVVYSLAGGRTDYKAAIEIQPDDRAWFEQVCDEQFVQAKLKM